MKTKHKKRKKELEKIGHCLIQLDCMLKEKKMKQDIVEFILDESFSVESVDTEISFEDSNALHSHSLYHKSPCLISIRGRIKK